MSPRTTDRRVLLLSPEHIRARMAGIGIRFWEMATALAGSFEVTLAGPEPVAADLAPAASFHLRAHSGAAMAELVAEADAVVLHGHVSDAFFAAIPEAASPPLVIDLYDPFPIENLNYFSTLGDEPYRRDRATISRQLERGDLFLCSTAEQRLFYLGALYALGRLTPQAYFEDFNLEQLVRIAPFGVPAKPPTKAEPVLRNVLPAAGADDEVIYFGGIYDWYDPLLLLGALERLLPDHPTLRVIFARNPNPESTPQGRYAEVERMASAKGWRDEHVFFLPWMDHDSHGRLLLESTLAVALHERRFETELSLRTRVLDFAWAGVPAVISAGGAMSRLAVEQGFGRAVPPGDLERLTTTISDLLASQSERKRMSTAGRAWAATQTWERVLAPLIEFLEHPRIDRGKSRYRGAQGRTRRSWLTRWLAGKPETEP